MNTETFDNEYMNNVVSAFSDDTKETSLDDKIKILEKQLKSLKTQKKNSIYNPYIPDNIDMSNYNKLCNTFHMRVFHHLFDE